MVHVGTSGWSYPEWRGRFYPAGLPPARMLRHYAERFRTVELNSTFYRMPTAGAVAGWARDTPPGFIFAPRVPRGITHFARLHDVADRLGELLDRLAGLGPKRGPLLLQLPPNFGKDPARLDRCLALLPPSVRTAVELRHTSWLDDEVYAMLRARNAALCVADTEAGTTPLVPTADFGYLRLRDRVYLRGELARWAATAARPEWRDAFVYFKHEETGTGPALAAKLIGLLGAAAPSGRPSVRLVAARPERAALRCAGSAAGPSDDAPRAGRRARKSHRRTP